jgi:hypothetical protein
LLLVVVAVALVGCSSDAGGETKECEADQFFCEGSTLRKCTMDGADSVLVEVCDEQCVGGQCVQFAPGDATGDGVEPGDAQADAADVVAPPEEVSPDVTPEVEPPQDVQPELPPVDVEEVTPPEEVTEEVAPDAGCQHECAENDFYCIGIKEIHQCVLGDDGCRHWDDGVACDDGNACTDDACSGDKGCVTAPNKEPCDDGDECTSGDACANNACTGGTPVVCEDFNDCTLDSCDPAQGCLYGKLDGTDCGTNGKCANGVCDENPEGPLTLADGLDGPWDLAIDDQNVYFVEDDAGTVKQVSKGGGQVTTLASDCVEPMAVAADSTHVYWIERNDGSNGRLRRVLKGGGVAQDVATGLHNAQNHLVVTGGFAFFGDGKAGGGGLIRKAAVDGSGVVLLVEGNGLLNLNTAIDVEAGQVYFRNDYDKILRVSVDGGAVTELGSGEPSAIDVFGTYLYFSEYSNGTVNRMPLAGGAVTQLVSGKDSVSNVVSDGERVYWTEFTNPGQVGSVLIGGGGEKTYSTQCNSIGLAVDNQYVYFTVSVFINQGKIVRELK